MKCTTKKAEGSIFMNEMWTTGLHKIVNIPFLYYFHEL